ncbi:MAG: DUF4003 domain-containing protein [Lachnospiraceae bacterium]|nr:DUF4003 domain-containing protein [Lachnospiraceae bacterium]
MKDELRAFCESFIRNRDIIKSTFKMENATVATVCANRFAKLGIDADAEKLKECRRILREKTGVFSNFRGTLELPITTMMASKTSSEAFLERTIEIYNELKAAFHSSTHLIMAAAAMAEMVPSGDVSDRIARGKEIYNRMKKEHSFLTNYEDTIFAMLLAFSEKDIDTLINEQEVAFKTLKESIKPDLNSLQSATHILSITNGEIEDKCMKINEIFTNLKNNGRKYSKYYEFPVLAVLADSDMSAYDVVMDMLDADAFLATQKGYGFFGVTKDVRLMHAALLVSDMISGNEISDNGIADITTLAETLAMVAAEQATTAAILVSITASTSVTH